METAFKINGINMHKILLLWVVLSICYSNGSAHPIGSYYSNRALVGNFLTDNYPSADNNPITLQRNSSNESLAAPTILLVVDGIQFSIAQLSWTSNPTPSDGTYFIERQDPLSGLWEDIKQLPYDATLYYEDTISHPYCPKLDPFDIYYNFFYRIRFESALGDTVYSNTPPAVLLADGRNNPRSVSNLVVSINSLRQPVLTWSLITDDEIMMYEINRYNGQYPSFLTNIPASTNIFVDDDILIDGCANSYKYVIVPIDLCGNRNADYYDDKSVQTIKLDPLTIEECERLAKLSWNPYSHMPSGLGGYKVYRMDNYAAPFEVVNITDTLITEYVDAYNFENGHTYIYYIEAYSKNNNYSSLSCQQGSLYNGANVADSVYISTLSVNNDSYISVMYYSTPDETVKTLVLERSDDGGLTYHTVDSATVAIGFFPQQGVLNDSSADVHSQSYYYRVVAIDFCGIHRLYSNVSRSVFLQCSATETQNTIEWNGYESWLKGVEGYQVWRNWDIASATGELLADVPAGVHSYDDPLSGIDPNEEVCYAVMAYESPASPYLTNAYSWSNICCISKDAKLYMPNAFNPNGANYRFRPVATSVDTDSFKMTIFNRWGQQIYETTDIINGWDGNIDGKTATTGLYGYIIKYRSTSGQDYTTRGTVSIVK